MYGYFYYYQKHLFNIQQTGVTMKFTNAVCQGYNESMITIQKCRIRTVNRYKNIFNYNSTVRYKSAHPAFKKRKWIQALAVRYYRCLPVFKETK